MKKKSEQQIKETIENLIQAGTRYDINQLELIYHKSLQVIMINETGDKMISNKQDFKDLFQSKLNNGDAPLNTWALFNHIDVQENKGHVIITRKVNLTGKEQKLILSIDLIKEENRWQVTREIIVTQA